MSDFRIRRQGEAAIVAPGGDVLSSSAPQMRAALCELVHSGIHDIVFDLKRTSIIDSAGWGLLLAAFNSVQAVGGKVTLVHAGDEILELCRTMHLDQYFAVSGR